MKKFFLAVFVAATFILYSVHQRNEGSAAVVTPAPAGSGTSPGITASPTYKDGQYTGDTANAYYGYIQVKAIIQNGKITDVQFLQYPNDRDTSVRINSQAMSYLKQEAIQAQTAHVDIISGATDSSQAFVESLASALSKAQS